MENHWWFAAIFEEDLCPGIDQNSKDKEYHDRHSNEPRRYVGG
jgi:hypothetical protein